MMNQVQVQRVIVLGALALSGVVSACSEEPQQPQISPRTVAVAEAQPAETVAVATDTAVPAAAVRTNIGYGEAESVFRKGRYDEANVLFRSYVAAHPGSAQGQYMLGLSAWKAGDHPTAEQALLRAVELDGESVKARTNLARVLLEQGQPAAALPHLLRAVEIAPESHEVWRVLGNAHAQLGHLDEALEDYRAAMMRNERDAWSMNNYGLALIQLGRFEDAIPPLARAVELIRSPLFLNNLGIALERAGQLGSARAAFAGAVTADSTFTRAVVSLDRVERRLGDDTGDEIDLTSYARCFADEIRTWIADEEHGC